MEVMLQVESKLVREIMDERNWQGSMSVLLVVSVIIGYTMQEHANDKEGKSGWNHKGYDCLLIM